MVTIYGIIRTNWDGMPYARRRAPTESENPKEQTAQCGQNRVRAAEIHGCNAHETTVIGHVLDKLGTVSQGKMCTCRTTDETRKQHRLIFDCIYLDTCRLGCFRKLPHRTQTQSPYSLIKEELKQE